MSQNNHKKVGILGKICKIIFFTIAGIVLIVATIILFKAKTNPDKVPDIFGYKPMIVLTGSMETSIHTGDLIFVKMVDTTSLKENDVIAFRNEKDTVTTHRIVEIVYDDGKQYFRTKGDANNAEDADLVEMQDVEGKYIFRIAGLGSFLMFIQKPTGLAMILLVILVIGLLWLYLVNKKDEKKYRQEEEKERKEFEEYKRQKELKQQELKQSEEKLEEKEEDKK